jgi:ankyrin repeat protein
VKSSSVSIEEEDAELYLKCAVEEGDAASVKLCLDQGASVNCKFKDDLYTPLHTACSSGTSKGSIDVLNLLLVEGADPNACNKWRETPLLIAANNGHIAACEALLEHGADPSLCSEAGWSALTFAAHKVRAPEVGDCPAVTRDLAFLTLRY